MGCASKILLVALTAYWCTSMPTLGFIPTNNIPPELECRLFVKNNGRMIAKAKMTVTPVQESSITHEFSPNKFVEAAVACEIYGEPFKLTEYVQTDDKITCSCSNQFGLPKNAQIEQKFEDNSWSPISSWITQSIEMFQMTALKTMSNDTSYRCTFRFDDRFRNNVQPNRRWGNLIVVFWFTACILVVLIKILPELYRATKRAISAAFQRD